MDQWQSASRHDGARAYVAAAALFVLAWLVLSWPWLSGAVTIPWDAKAHWYPHIRFLADALARGESPFWAPQLFAGAPEIADPQSAIFSLPLLLLALADPAPGFRLVDGAVLVMAGLGGMAVLLWFRDRGWHWAAAVMAALAFSFGGSMAWRVQHIGQVMSLAYLAMAFWLLERALARRALGWGAAAGAMAGLMLAGRDQVALLGAYVLAARVAWHWGALLMADGRRGRGALAPVVVAVLVAGLISAWPVWLSAQLAALSNRPAIDLAGAEAGSLHPALLFTALVPDLFAARGPMAAYWGPPSFAWPDTGLFLAQNMGVLYIGAIPVLLLLGPGILRGAAARAAIRGASLALMATLLYALGRYTPVFAMLHGLLPGVDLFRRPADATFILGAAAAVVAGYLLHRHLTEPPAHRATRRAWLHLVAVIGLCAAIIALALARGRLAQALEPLLASGITLVLAVVVLGWARGRPSLLAGLAVISFTTGDLAVHNGPNGSTGLAPRTYDVLRPESDNETLAILVARRRDSILDARRDRVEIAGLGFAWQNAALVHGFEQTLGYNPVRLAHYARAVAPEDAIALPAQRRFTPLMPSYRSVMADLLGLRWIVTGVPVEEMDRALKPGDLVPAGRTADGYVYENPRALPRALFVAEARRADFAALLERGAWPVFDPRRTVLIEGEPAPPGDASKGRGTVVIRTYEAGRVVLAVVAPQPGYLVLNDVWHPWWAVEVDGAPMPLLRANVIFRAVALPAGRHEVVFAFRPVAATIDAARRALAAVVESRRPLR